MKKLALLLLALITVLAMVACGNTDETTLPADDATDPVVTEPVETEPVETEPVETEPVVTEPVETEPVETEPVETEPAETEPTDAEADLPACTCENENLSNISVQTTDTGLVYKCKRCGGVYKTVIIGNGPIYDTPYISLNGATTLGGDTVLNGHKYTVMGQEIGDKFFLTYDVTPEDLSPAAEGKIFSFTSFKFSLPGAASYFGHLVRVKNEGGGMYRVVLGNDIETEVFMEIGQTYSFVFEFEYTRGDTSKPEYVDKMAECRVFMNGEYIGRMETPFDRSTLPNVTIRLVATAAMKATFTNLKLYKAEIIK